MPKLKSKSGALKRFKKTGSGRFKHRQANRGHILTKKTAKRKRHLRGMVLVNERDQASIQQCLPYA